MPKGLQRSLDRGPKLQQEIVKQPIRLQSKAISVSSITTGPGTGTVVLEGLPEGNLVFLGCVANLQFSGSGADANLVDTWEGDYAIGTAPLTGTTISADEEDLIASTAIAAATAEVSPVTRGVHATGDTGQTHNNTANSLEVNLNLLIDAADIGDGATVAMTVDGTVTLSYIMMLDD